MTPEWLSAWSTLLGVIFAFLTFLKLISKDSEKEQQIRSLTKIAEEQAFISNQLQQQVQELKKQTLEFVEQTKVMTDTHGLMQKENLREEERMTVTRKDRIKAIKPEFGVSNSGTWYSHRFEFELSNKNKIEAMSIRLDDTPVPNIGINPIKLSKTPEGNQTLIISGSDLVGKYRENLSDLEFGFDLYFTDIDGNKYIQRINKPENGFIAIADVKHHTSD